MSPARTIPGFALLAAFALSGAFAGCSRSTETTQSTFYDRKIGPILTASCATSPSNSSCHVAADDHGNAFGNLNVSSYETVTLRRDLLINHGPYNFPALLLKVLPPYQIQITNWDNEPIPIRTDIAHAGGSILDATSPSLNQIQRWIGNGATKNNAAAAAKTYDKTDCKDQLGSDPDFDPSVAPTDPDYAQFGPVNDLFGKSCAFGNCHGSAPNTLYLTCGTSEEEKRWNYFVASRYSTKEPTQTELLRRTLSPSQGGVYHEGGTIFSSPNDVGYQTILSWVTAKGPAIPPSDPAFTFFYQRVQPELVARGCMQIQCHSVTMFHDYRLRGGSAGQFSLSATLKNYELSLEQVALESPDPNASRIIRKNLPPNATGHGILHRGGALFADGGDPTQCDSAAAQTGALDADPPVTSPYCVIAEWIKMEQAELMPGAMPLSSIVYVKRPPAPQPDTPQDWATYAPGADLIQATASLDAQGNVTAGGGSSLLSGCGLSPSSADVRRPAVSWDGTKIAFSARSSASEPFKVYVIDGSNCAPDPTINAPPVDDTGAAVPDNGELIHDFDPTFSPDGRIVFVSTRGNVMNAGAFSYHGPTRTPADPSKLNTNLYVSENGKIRQLTFVLNQELYPSFMSDGRLIMSAEKRAPGFYQLALRRENIDGGDYHPLFAQRNTVDFNQASNVVELADKNFAMILSDRGAVHGAGALAVVNRSIGVDQLSGNPDDYTQDPNAIGWPNPAFFQHSIKILDPKATGKGATDGAYRDPSPLPDGKMLVSHAPNVADVTAFDGKFEIEVMDPVTATPTTLLTDPNDDLIWPVAVYARGKHGTFKSRVDEANGNTTVYTDDQHKAQSQITVIDTPLIASLLFQNTRTGRHIAGNYPLEVWESLPPEPGVTSFDQGGAYVTDDQYGKVYVRRRLLGAADLESDGSTKVLITGGMPITLATTVQLASDGAPTKHFQREEMQFYPGEWSHQSFQRKFFNGLCGGCHGAVSGYDSELAVNPDILTQASIVEASTTAPIDITGGTGTTQGPPFP
jgi:WD40-like Beta Propeller Repeat